MKTTIPGRSRFLLERKTAAAPATKQQRLAVPFEVKADSVDEEARTFRGLASTWEEDLGGDVIHKGAFKRTLKAWQDSKKVLPLIDQHNYGSVRAVVGKMTAAAETDAGLEAEFEIIDGPDGDEILRRVKGGYIDSLSIGYRAVKWDMETPEGAQSWESIRHLKEVQLYEVSVVIWPMNPGAVIDPSSVKALVDAIRDGSLTDEQRAELKGLSPEIKQELRALLEDEPAPDPAEGDEPDATPPADEPKGLAPEDAERIRMDETLRGLILRSLATA